MTPNIIEILGAPHVFGVRAARVDLLEEVEDGNRKGATTARRAGLPKRRVTARRHAPARRFRWRRALLTLLDVDVRNGFQPQPNFARLVALRRVVLCADLHEQHRRELLRRYHPVEPAHVYLVAFGTPL